MEEGKRKGGRRKRRGKTDSLSGSVSIETVAWVTRHEITTMEPFTCFVQIRHLSPDSLSDKEF